MLYMNDRCCRLSLSQIEKHLELPFIVIRDIDFQSKITTDRSSSLLRGDYCIDYCITATKDHVI